jgi:hypothetical protein
VEDWRAGCARGAFRGLEVRIQSLLIGEVANGTVLAVGEREDLCPFGIESGEDLEDRGGPDPLDRRDHRALWRASDGLKNCSLQKV